MYEKRLVTQTLELSSVWGYSIDQLYGIMKAYRQAARRYEPAGSLPTMESIMNIYDFYVQSCAISDDQLPMMNDDFGAAVLTFNRIPEEDIQAFEDRKQVIVHPSYPLVHHLLRHWQCSFYDESTDDIPEACIHPPLRGVW